MASGLRINSSAVADVVSVLYEAAALVQTLPAYCTADFGDTAVAEAMAHFGQACTSLADDLAEGLNVSGMNATRMNESFTELDRGLAVMIAEGGSW